MPNTPYQTRQAGRPDARHVVAVRRDAAARVVTSHPETGSTVSKTRSGLRSQTRGCPSLVDNAENSQPTSPSSTRPQPCTSCLTTLILYPNCLDYAEKAAREGSLGGPVSASAEGDGQFYRPSITEGLFAARVPSQRARGIDILTCRIAHSAPTPRNSAGVSHSTVCSFFTLHLL